jgi:hypothetical protein
MMKKGKDAPPPLPFDNPGIHFSVIKEFCLTSEFEELPQNIQQSIIQRAMYFQQMLNQQQQQVMQAAQAAKGTDQQTSQAISASGATGRPVAVTR